ncbi:unnamed protein product [Closterium sp. NIES-64]|nr:unnamed protein product [Closterium sp. NIES-64]
MDHGSGEGKLESAPKFDGSDYWTWSFRFEQWAEAHDLWGYFDGSEERPATGDARLMWERKNQKAFAQFCNALVPDELIRLVREFGGKTELGSAPVDGAARAVTRVPAGTAAAYTRVKEFYLQRGLCNRMALSEELSSLKMKEGEGVAAYWARAEDLRSNGGRGSNGKAQVADEEEQDDKAEAVVGEAGKAAVERSSQPREGWWIDSGASHNFTPYASDFKSKLQPPEVRGVRLGDGRVVKAVGMGEVPVVGAGGQLLRIQKVHLVPEMHTRLLSVPHLTSRDVIATFKGKKCVFNGGSGCWRLEKRRGKGTMDWVTHSALPASITPMEAWSGQKPHVGMARIWGCMGSVMLHGHEKGGKLDARAVMCVCVGVDMESKGWRMLDPSLMRIRIARDVDFLENVMWKDWDKAKGFGELLQDAAAISQLLPLPLSPSSAMADDVEMPPSSLPPAPLSVSVQQLPTPLQQLSGPSVIQRRSATQATSSSSSPG